MNIIKFYRLGIHIILNIIIHTQCDPFNSRLQYLFIFKHFIVQFE